MPPSPKENFSEEEKALLTEEELAHLDDDLNDDVEEVDDDAAAAAAEAAKEAEDRAAAAKKAEDDAAAAAQTEEDKRKADAEAQRKADELAAQKAAADAGDEEAKKAIADREKAEADAKAAADAAAAEDAEEEAPAAMDGVKERSPKMVEADLEAIDKDLDAIAAKFDDGDITAVEMRTQQAALLKQQRELTVELTTAAVSSKTWSTKTVPAFLAKHPEYKADPELMGELDKAVRDAQAKAGRQYDPSFLETAHKALAPKVDAVKAKITAAEEATVRKVLGLGPNDPLPKKASPAATSAKNPAERIIPPTLGKVPAADANDAGDGGKYAALDRLAGKDPIAYEKAFEKLSQAEQDDYLAR